MPSLEPVVLGLPDADLPVAAYFDAFDWEGKAPDPGLLSAEDFLSALGP